MKGLSFLQHGRSVTIWREHFPDQDDLLAAVDDLRRLFARPVRVRECFPGLNLEPLPWDEAGEIR